MHYAIVSLGGTGSLLPLITLGRELKRRGHRITVIAGPPYEKLATKNCLEFASIAPALEYKRGIFDQVLLATRYWRLFVLRHGIEWNFNIYRILQANASSRMTVIAVDHAFLWADLLAYAHSEIKAIRVQFNPPMLSKHAPPDYALIRTQAQRALERRCYEKWGDRVVALNLDPNKYESFDSIRQRVSVIGLWPKWLAAESDRIATIGFLPPVDLDLVDKAACHAEVKESHIIFVAGTVGTTRWWYDRFFKTSIEICRSLQSKGILLGSADERPGVTLPEFVIWSGFAPLDRLLPNAKVIVHHGGVGTAAVAARFGVPQLVVPRVGAQSSNAERLRNLGLCKVLLPEHYTASSGSGAIMSLLADGAYQARALEISRRHNESAEVQTVCDVFDVSDERMARCWPNA
jgi:rhamnosyltransferase subunit B